jgi:sec-independent protein translocase protein TatA
MPSLGPPELIVILVLVVIVFGVGKLPEVGGALGKSIKEFRRASEAGDERPGQDEIARESTERREKTA